MEEQIKMMLENYELGFISSMDFLSQYKNILQLFGAHKCIEDKMNEALSDLANGIFKMLKSGNETNNQIENFGTPAFN